MFQPRLWATQPKIAINMKAQSTPWGGGNQFVEQLHTYLKSQGYGVTYRLEPGVSAILLIEPRPFPTTLFGVDEIRRFKAQYPHVRCVHRINECDQRKGTSDVDEILRQANEAVADMTVFISDWLKSYFIERWFEPHRPHGVIHNGADPKIYYPVHDKGYKVDTTFRVVTHHWSDNWMKGFKVYQEVDRLIAEGELTNMSLMVIGQWPKEIQWHTATALPPTRGKELATLLRQNHLYLTASLWEPGGMHFIEGAQCGLPIVYHADGGGIVELAQQYGIGFCTNVKEALLQARTAYGQLRNAVLASSPSGLKMCQQFAAVLVEPIFDKQ